MTAVLTALRRKAKQILGDPILRKWLVARALQRWPAPPPHIPGQPPYLQNCTLDMPARMNCAMGTMAPPPPRKPIRLSLPGTELTVAPDDADRAIVSTFPDTETLLGLHRFAWLPLNPEVDPAWVNTLWQAWATHFGTPDGSWAWHPYTAAERAINILSFAHRHGLPGDRQATLILLAHHGIEIARRLEYFGDHYTGNHLANNGRGLFLLGLALGWPQAADLGGRILLAEADRIFAPSGILSEGSSHYHLLLTRNYISAWLAARRHNRPETMQLMRVAGRALAVIPYLSLSGGLPLVGDISPDCPPETLANLISHGSTETGWIAGLNAEDGNALAELALPTVDPTTLAADGWLKGEYGDWSGLWYAAPEGWPPMPGHGHQDLGGFELHWRDIPLFVDVGRGAYGDEGQAAFYRSSAVHNVLTIDNQDTTPPNRAYYHPGFRRQIIGNTPQLRRLDDGVTLTHAGFSRIGIPLVERRWRFTGNSLRLEDHVAGRGTRMVTRRLVSPWPTSLEQGRAVITTPAGNIQITADVPLNIRPLVRWTAYGRGTTATALEAVHSTTLPFTGTIVVEKL